MSTLAITAALAIAFPLASLQAPAQTGKVGAPGIETKSGGDIAAAKRIKVPGNKQQAKLVNRVSPVYPPECKAEKVEGSLSFRTVISKAGEPIEIVLTTEDADKRLVNSARDALRLWRWEPTLLNGEPVEVITDIEVNFRLAK